MADPSPPTKVAAPVKTQDDDSPTAPIRSLVAHSLALSSPIRQIQIPASPHPPAGTSIQPQFPGESPSPPLDKTLATSSSDKMDVNEIMEAEISPENDKILQIASTSYSVAADKNFNFDYQSDDDDYKIEPINSVFSWSSPKIIPTGVGAGLENSGNTCFIASVLQCFTHTVPLIESLRSYNYQTPCNCGNEKFCVMLALREHIELALRSSGYSLTVDRFRYNLNHFSPDFLINNQEDAQEFLQSFLDKLERCCLDRRNKPESITSHDLNIVDHVFGGRLLSKLRCCNCDSFSDTFEPTLGWSLEIEDVDNLWSALESFTRVEKLEDQFTCDNCKEKVSKEKQLKLDKLPLVATFHLKRFKNDGVTMEKIFKQVEFPLELDLLPYMSNNEDPEVSTKYYLYAMVEHIGNGVSFGHYSSYVRSAPMTWHSFDDAKVRRISEDYVLSQNAYILFYAREGTPWFSTEYEELKTMFEAKQFNFSPTSVLETTTCRQECVDDHSYVNVCSSKIPSGNDMDFHCHEPQEEVFHSAESGGCADETEIQFAETSHQEEPCLYPAADKVFTHDDDDASVPVPKVLKQDLSPKRKADESAILGDAYRPKIKLQRKGSLSKPQGAFQIQREHLQIKKPKEEARGTKGVRSIVAASADPKDKEIAMSYVKRMPSTSRSRMLAAALGGSSVNKKKVS